MTYPALGKDHYLLLIFKDYELPKSTDKGFVLVSESPTIIRHLAINNPSLIKEYGLVEENERITTQQLSLSIERDDLWPSSALGKDTCVWGWWRKPWEYHPILFERIKSLCNNDRKLSVLLYNQYLRKIYTATLRDIHFLPFLTSVTIPVNWRKACPTYYRDEKRRCGAFFLLKLDKRLDLSSTTLESKRVDSASFELRPYDLDMVIPPEESVYKSTPLLVDQQFDRDSLRISDHTVFLLRKNRQYDNTKQLLMSKKEPSAGELANAFKETDWNDTRQLLTITTPAGWKHLSNSPDALSVIAKKALRAGSRITRFDLELSSWLFADSSLKDLLVSLDSFTNLGESIRTWVTAGTAAEARNSAAEVFLEAWKVADVRYRLKPIKDYFEKLPAFEGVASTVHYEIDKKLYRDHLSHNVRAALIGAKIAASANPPALEKVDTQKICFFAGLLHDIAFPITSYPDTAQKLANVIASIQGHILNQQQASLINNEFIQLSLHYVALMSSARSLLKAYPKGCSPWDDLSGTIDKCDPRLLDELLLSAKAEDHAIVSAAILFHRAVLSRCQADPEKTDLGVRELMNHMTASNASPEFKELLAIIQCVALHDRKASLRFHPVATSARDVPAHLTWKDFALPIIVSTADEFQEWGRPVGALEGMGVVDAEVSFKVGEIVAQYTWNTDQKVFKDVPYSLLFMLFGKLSACRGYRFSKDGRETPFEVKCELKKLNAMRLYFFTEDKFIIKFKSDTKSFVLANWPSESCPPGELNGQAGQYLLGIKSETSDEKKGHDFLIIEGEENVCEMIKETARRNEMLNRISFTRKTIEFECNDGRLFTGEVVEMHRGTIKHIESFPSEWFPPNGASTVLRISLNRLEDKNQIIPQNRTGTPQNWPHPHFLDYDWRFTERTARWIIKAANYYRFEGRVCYLGCPTLALWHSILCKDEDHWCLLDRGHFALRQWCGQYIPESKWIKYDVIGLPPSELLGTFRLVVTDPPWHDNEYRAFCRRAAQLVEVGGFVLLSSYPGAPPYKADKYTRLERIVKQELGNPTWLGSLEIDYEVPEFENVWKGHEKFQHLGFGVYRPGYIDCLRIPGRPSLLGELEVSCCQLPVTCDLGDGHHLRHRENIDWKGKKVILSRHTSLQHIDKVDNDILAWTSRNVIVREQMDGQEIESLDDLVVCIRRWEATNGTSV